MLSYIHSFHAGNHADILKHSTISLILDYLCKKEKPFTVIDTHAGSGIYNLNDERLEKTGEARTGIELFLKETEKTQVKIDHSEELNLLEPYLKIVRPLYEKRLYPGSPFIENTFLRKGDVQILSELHPKTIEELKANSKTFKNQVQIHYRNGYELLRAITPPEIKRGICVIDPSFEEKSDYETCGTIIAQIHKKWPVGIIALWYPLVAHRKMEISEMKERISCSSHDLEDKILDIELQVKKEEEMTGLASLYGSGMFIINPPYQLDQNMKKIIPFIKKMLKVEN